MYLTAIEHEPALLEIEDLRDYKTPGLGAEFGGAYVRHQAPDQLLLLGR